MTNQECADMLRRARARQRQEEADRLERLMFTHRVTARCQLADALNSRYTPAPTPNASLKPYAIAAVLVLVLMSAASAALLTITGA